MAITKFAHGGNIYELDRDKRIYDFSANINPLGIPCETQQALCSQIQNIVNYPDPRAQELVAGISSYWKISPENILVGNGSVELLYDIVRAFSPKTAVIPVPSFSEYERALRLINCRAQFVCLKEKDGFSCDVSKMPAADLLLFGHPNNPTGNLVLSENEKLKDLYFKKIIIDEAFMDFVFGEKKFSFIRKAVKNKKLTVLRTFTKFFALPGLRVGYMIAHKDIVQRVRQVQVPWNCNIMAQTAALSMLKDNDYAQKTQSLILRERKWLCSQLSALPGLRVYPSVVNFLLVKIKKQNITVRKLQDALLEKGILIRDCDNFRSLSGGFFRIAVRTRKENVILAQAIEEVLCR